MGEYHWQRGHSPTTFPHDHWGEPGERVCQSGGLLWAWAVRAPVVPRVGFGPAGVPRGQSSRCFGWASAPPAPRVDTATVASHGGCAAKAFGLWGGAPAPWPGSGLERNSLVMLVPRYARRGLLIHKLYYYYDYSYYYCDVYYSYYY